MIAYGHNTIYATKDKWGLVQNSISLSGLESIEIANGWPAAFCVGDKNYQGLGWHISNQYLQFVIDHRNAVPVEQ